VKEKMTLAENMPKRIKLEQRTLLEQFFLCGMLLYYFAIARH